LPKGSYGKFFYDNGDRIKKPVKLILTDSDIALAYRKNTSIFYKTYKSKFLNLINDLKLEPPYNIVFKFVRDSKRQFDYINAAQVVQDLMVEHGWIIDDSCLFVKPYFIDYEVDKKNPGVYISIF
jgi:hypothetical protein